MPADRELLPIACTLSASDHGARVAWIKELNSIALTNYQHDDNRILLTYHPAAAATVRELIRLEQQCCTFLRFTFEEEPEAFVVTIDTPAQLETAADELFASYNSTAAADHSRGARASGSSQER